MDDFDLYHKRCRLCASEHRLGLNMFGVEGVALELQSKIKMYLSIDVSSGDELPKRVCYQCLYRIETFHSFKQSCIESEHTLRNWHLFYGGFAGRNASETTEEFVSVNESETLTVLSSSEQEKMNSNDNTRISPSVSVESVAQPTTSSLSKMAETVINKQSKHAKVHSKINTVKTSVQKKQLPNSSGKVDIVAVKSGRNVVRISGDDQERDPKDAALSGDNSEVSRILLNMSGVGTISVTKFEGTGTRDKNASSSKTDKSAMEEGEVEKQQTEYLVCSDDEESDGFSGFDFDDTNAVSTEEYVKDESMVLGELVPSECIKFEHLEVDGNGSVHVVQDKSSKVEGSEEKDPLRYMMVTMDDSGSTRYACIKCNKTFAQKSYVKEHMKIHTGEKPFMCMDCGRSFRNNYMLKVHFRLHTGEKNFKCEECGALFTERGALVSHSRTHSGIKPFVCKFCDRKFAQNPALKRHLRIHTKEKPYNCEHCDSSFADRGTWRNHVRTHTGERPYDCTLCGKSFVQRTNLQAHIKTHTDERPFLCQMCGSSFRTKAHLVKHLSTIHRDVMKSVVTYMKDPKVESPAHLKG
ncbi:uncharacterized protein [Periplaneta americana]|uniref:uncharacterized protein n=1 Tax=Periplaneta americana TaxID=6978 RepID=UPI0037E986B5